MQGLPSRPRREAAEATRHRRSSLTGVSPRKSSLTGRPLHPHALALRRKKSRSEAVLFALETGQSSEGRKVEGNAALGHALFLNLASNPGGDDAPSPRSRSRTL